MMSTNKLSTYRDPANVVKVEEPEKQFHEIVADLVEAHKSSENKKRHKAFLFFSKRIEKAVLKASKKGKNSVDYYPGFFTFLFGGNVNYWDEHMSKMLSRHFPYFNISWHRNYDRSHNYNYVQLSW